MNQKLAELEKTIEGILKGSGSLNEYNASITAGAIINVLRESGLLDNQAVSDNIAGKCIK